MRLSRTFRLAALSIAICALMPGAVQATSQAVTIQNFAFAPQTVTINVGESVTWTNHDPVDHTATANNGAFNKPVAPNTSVTVAFSVAGTYAYHCAIHPSMTGTVIVATTASPPPTATAPPTTPPPTAPPPTTRPPTAPPSAPPTAAPTAPPTASPTPSVSPSSSVPATSSPAPTATGAPITVPSGVALASPSAAPGPGPELGSGSGPILAAGALAFALILGGAAFYLYRRR